MITDGELHCELRLSLKEEGGREREVENRVREALGLALDVAARDCPGPHLGMMSKAVLKKLALCLESKCGI